jgi:hypothetical protein
MDKRAIRRHYETLAKHQYNKRMLELELEELDAPETPCPTAPLITETWCLIQDYDKKIQANNRAGVALKLERVIIDMEYLEQSHLLSLKGLFNR